MIRSVLRGWMWILGSAVFAALVITWSWMSAPQLFRTSAEIRVLPARDPVLWDDAAAHDRSVASEGQKIIAMAMGGGVKDAVGSSDDLAERFGLDITTEHGRQAWSEIWDRHVMMAGPVDDEIFLIVDDEDGERGAALAGAVLEALEVEWRRRAGEFDHQSIDRLDRLIAEDMVFLESLTEQCSHLPGDLKQPEQLVLLAARDNLAQQVAESRIRRKRLESSSLDQPLPWMVVKSPFPFEYHVRKVPNIPIVLSALTLVFLVGVGWVVHDPRNQ